MDEIKRIFLDTDIGPDCDDAAAVALSVIFCRQFGKKLIGVTHCTSSPWGVGAINAILDWYGAKNIPVGTMSRKGFLDEEENMTYNRELALSVPAEKRIAPDAVQVMRKALQDSPDGSVDIVGIGPFGNLADLISDEEGRTLVQQKVRRLIIMAGDFAEGCDEPQWNIEMDIPAGRKVVDEWPGDVLFCGYEVGKDVIALAEPTGLKDDNPVRIAYLRYRKGQGRSSWDLCSVQYTVDENCPFYSLSEPGRVTLDDRAVSHFTPAEGGNHYLIKKIVPPDVIARFFEQTLLQAEP